jgi:CBS domain-containing protein
MTRPALTIPADADIREAAQRMLYAEVHRLFIEKNGALAG